MKRGIFSFVFLAAAWLSGFQAAAQQNVISTLIGGGPNNMPATDADVSGPVVVALDGAGNYYIAAYNQNRVFKADTTGILTVFAGNGVPGYAGDGVSGGAASASLNGPYGVAVDQSGNVYISEYGNSVIRRVDTTNTITTVAGIQGSCGYNGDGAPATNFKLCEPAGLAVDGSGNLYIADSTNCRIRELVVSTDTISTYAGNGTCFFSGDGAPAVSARLHTPYGVAVDGAGNVYISDTLNYRIRLVKQATGIISTIAGDGTQGYAGDGGYATKAEIGGIDQGVAVNSTGTTVTVGDLLNNRIRQFKVGGKIHTVAGTGSASFCGDGGPASSACFSSPEGVAVSASGVIYVADPADNRIRQFTVEGTISTVAGNGGAAQPTLTNQVTAGGVVLNNPWGALEDSSGDIFVSDQNNFMVRELVKSTGLVDFFAGTGTQGYGGDNGPATQALLNYTGGVALDSFGNIYIADTYNHCIRQVSSSGTITTFAGTPGVCGYSGDGDSPTNAQLCYPQSVFVDSTGNVYIADTNNQAIRLVTGGTITTLAGTGTQGYLGDGGTATSAELSYPEGVAADGLGNLYIADTTNCVIRQVVLTTGIINTVAGNGICGFSGDGPATANELYYPAAVSADLNGNLFIADSANNLLRWVNPTGSMVTFAGTPQAGYNGDGGQATAAELDNPSSISQDASGNFIVADQNNFRIRGIAAFAAANPSQSSMVLPDTAPGLTSAQSLQIVGLGPLLIGTVSVTGNFSVQEQSGADARNATGKCGPSLPTGQTCTLKVTFKPKTTGTQTGALTIKSNAYFGGQTTISLQGLGGAVKVSSAAVAFGNQAVNTTSAAKRVVITNLSTNTISMGTIALTETLDFAISAKTCKNSLPAGKSCSVTLTFKPQASGAKASTLVVKDSDATSPQNISITGTGV